MKIFLSGFGLYCGIVLMATAFVNCAKPNEVREPQSQSIEIQDYAKCFKGELCGSNTNSVCYSPETYYVLPEDPEIICIKDGIDLGE